MSIAYCRDCNRIVEGKTIHGREIIVRTLDGGRISERSYELCPFCAQETVEFLPEDNPEEDR